MKPGIALITFTDETVHTKSGEKNGKAWEIREQDATIETPHMKNPCRVSLGKGQGAYKAGTYEYDVVRALKVSDFGSVQLARDMRLTLEAPAVRKVG